MPPQINRQKPPQIHNRSPHRAASTCQPQSPSNNPSSTNPVFTVRSPWGCLGTNALVLIATEFPGNKGKSAEPFAYLWSWTNTNKLSPPIKLSAVPIEALVAEPAPTRLRRVHDYRVVGDRLFVATDLGPIEGPWTFASEHARARAYSTWGLDGTLVNVTTFAGIAPRGGVFGAPETMQMNTLFGQNAMGEQIVI